MICHQDQRVKVQNKEIERALMSDYFLEKHIQEMQVQQETFQKIKTAQLPDWKFQLAYIKKEKGWLLSDVSRCMLLSC